MPVRREYIHKYGNLYTARSVVATVWMECWFSKVYGLWKSRAPANVPNIV